MYFFSYTINFCFGNIRLELYDNSWETFQINLFLMQNYFQAFLLSIKYFHWPYNVDIVVSKENKFTLDFFSQRANQISIRLSSHKYFKCELSLDQYLSSTKNLFCPNVFSQLLLFKDKFPVKFSIFFIIIVVVNYIDIIFNGCLVGL